MLQLIIALLLGIFAGTITGIIPGIHINLIAILIISTAIISQIPETQLLVFIVAMAITHTFLDFIPSIFFGAPDEDTALSTLPGHKFLLDGQGHHALKLTVLGSTIAITSLTFIVPVFIITIPKIFPFLQRMMAFFLIWITVFLVYNQKNGKLKALIIFFLAGFLGFASSNLSISQPLLPLLTGLFGTSTLIHSIKSKVVIPKQEIAKLKINKKELIKPTLATIFISPICSFFPGLGSSQAAIIASEITRKINREQFLILLGSINTLVMATSFLTLFLFQKSRTGAAFAISQITQVSTPTMIIIFTTILISSILAIPTTITISKLISKHIHKISYTKTSTIILIVLTIITTYFTGFLGLLVLITATLLGLTCIEFQTRRGFLMGAILIPTIIYYLPF